MHTQDAELRSGYSVNNLREALERVLGCGAPVLDRLSYAETSVSFRVNGHSDAVTVLVDRRPPKVGAADEPTEVDIEMTPEQAWLLARGRLPLPDAIATGAVAYRGPVRKYLAVEPIVRRLLAEQSDANGQEAYPGVSSPIRSELDLDPELAAIETRNLHKAFGSNHILEGTDLKIPEGVVATLLGPSGTGKSVVLQHIIGLLRPDAGEVIVRGRALSQMGRAELLQLRSEIGVMFQDGALFSTMNVYDNVAFPLRQHTNLPESDINEIVSSRLEEVGLTAAARKYGNQLSGGMRKRAGLARALVLDPGIILCDEPDSGLDPVRTALLGELLVETHSRIGGTMLVITHNIDLIRQISEHISVLYRGKVLEAGMAEQIYSSDTEFVRQFLAGAADGPLGMDA
jgi:phospholipid/cholesterol/gamma-HCH transport system ATP-binding protein